MITLDKRLHNTAESLDDYSHLSKLLIDAAERIKELEGME